MKYSILGKTGLCVSKICFGTLTLSPLQENLSPERSADLLLKAYEEGINFWDTAELYDNYPHLKLAVKKMGKLPVIATKTYAWNREEAIKSLEKARRELDVDIIPLFLLHEQESRLTLEGHKASLDFFMEAKEKGLIRGVGISCHTVAAVKAAASFEGIDVIHPIINFKGIGIKDGNLEEMQGAIAEAFNRGIGIYGMKILGGGHLIPEAEKAIRFAVGHPYLHSFALGMSSEEELLTALCLLEGKSPPERLSKKMALKKRKLYIEEWCTGCGTCVSHCPQHALSLHQGKAVVNLSACILCGYCGGYCPEFCIKIF